MRTIGHDFEGSLGWSYPPSFLFIAAALALMPYTAAFVAWTLATLACHAAAIAAIVRRRSAFVVACAAPWTFVALTPGQNGFFSAALVGIALLVVLQRRPARAGLLLGLLSYKPQLGILVPLALAAGGYWRAFTWAVVATLASNGLAALVFGSATVGAFFHSLSFVTQSHLTIAGLGWSKLQSVYGLVRSVGFSATAAWLAQLPATAAIALAVAVAWRADIPYSLKAALLVAAMPLATPYVFVYDLPVLAVAVAFLFRHHGFDRLELALLASTVPSVFAFLWVPMPSAFLASLAVCAIAARRCYLALSRTRISPSWATEATS